MSIFNPFQIHNLCRGEIWSLSRRREFQHCLTLGVALFVGDASSLHYSQGYLQAREILAKSAANATPGPGTLEWSQQHLLRRGRISVARVRCLSESSLLAAPQVQRLARLL